MGFCSRRHFLLTICTLQLLTTVERQVFDFLGFMWAPILVNFFNIIFVILGFFGTFQYRPKYLISYCIWQTLWLGWNIFCICFYLDVGMLDKTSDILNVGTGSFSWWLVNGPGCKADYNYTEPELFRPVRPTNVTDCVLSYEVIEVLHASTQCLLALMAIIGGICLSRAYLEEDDSFDFVGGGDFGLAGHTPLHPMYVSYSALPPASLPQSNQTYQSYPRGTTGSDNTSEYNRDCTLSINEDKFPFNHHQQRVKSLMTSHDTTRSNKSSASTRIIDNIDYYNDYSNPVDHLHRPVSPPGDYDSLNSSIKSKFEKNRTRCYSPVVSPVMRRARPSQATKQNRNSFKPRIFTDHIREQPLRTFYSDPRLAGDQSNSNDTHRDSRPISLYASKITE
ncbi:sodium/potassium-transporting ATPase subunit beta-1-interacting protein 2 isoform X2 [Diachasmimorpha longicaudata]|uniref:sodium/potassium-transporting ATPase subunit beta-1-interacting protein 2 isoform X2 n=1 Tax=Diachasmimorpha longicaudata TaxID=58733 RepID=UPI0030B87CCC